jgi:hypothetical protein
MVELVDMSKRSIVGSCLIISHGIISTKASAQTTAAPTMKLEPNQSSLSPRSSMTSSAPRKVATKTKPMGSNRADWRCRRSATEGSDSCRITAIKAIVTRPTGPLSMKHQRQEKLSASQPPSVGPTTGATTTAMPNSAKACPRFCGGKESARTDWAAGTMPPPAKP